MLRIVLLQFQTEYTLESSKLINKRYIIINSNKIVYLNKLVIRCNSKII